MGWGFSIPGTSVYLGEHGVTSRDSGTDIGSARYLIPGHGEAQLVADQRQNEENQAQAERDEAAAASRAQASRENLGRLRNSAKALADQYRSKLPSYQKGLVDVAMRTNRQKLAAGISKQNEGLQSRGLLTSGIAQGEASKAASSAKSELANEENQINKSVNDQASEFDDYVANLGLNMGTADLEQQNDYFKNALDNIQRRTQALGQVGGAIGNVAGSYLGSKG